MDLSLCVPWLLCGLPRPVHARLTGSDWDEDESSPSASRPFSQFEEQIMEQIPKLNMENSADKIRDACSILV